MDREQIAEQVGFYFGLQRACNLKRMPEEFCRLLLAEMKDTADKLPPGTIDSWPRNSEGAPAQAALSPAADHPLIRAFTGLISAYDLTFHQGSPQSVLRSAQQTLAVELARWIGVNNRGT